MKLFSSIQRREFWAKTLVVFFLFLSKTSALQTPADGQCFVYPSPSQGNSAWVVYNLPKSGTAIVYIYNEAGDLVTQTQQSDNVGIQQIYLDLTHYRSGIYICRVVLTLDSGAGSALPLFKFIVTK
jgi:hypothetical protein